MFNFRTRIQLGPWTSRLWLALLGLTLSLTFGSAHADSDLARTKVLVLGDSISAGYGINAEEGWVNLLQKSLTEAESGWQVVNASISGETTGGGLARLPKLLTEHDPAVVIIELGGNDGLRGYPVPKMRNNLQTMVEMVQQREAEAVLMAMRIPPNYGRRYTQAFEQAFVDVSEKFETVLVPFFLEPIALETGMMQADGIHPTATAQPLMRDFALQYLGPVLLD